MLLEYTIRLLSYTVGTALAVFLLLTALGKRSVKLADRILVLSLAAAAVWFGAQALDIYFPMTVALGDSGLRAMLQEVQSWAGLLLAASVLHLTLLWAGAPWWAGLAGWLVNRQALQHVVTNLVQNALDASPQNAAVRIEAGFERPGTIRLAITDAGAGVPEELQEKIFEPFYTTKSSGTGLGLAIAKKNVEELKGQLRVVSPLRDGRGSSFVVTFPGRPAAAGAK